MRVDVLTSLMQSAESVDLDAQNNAGDTALHLAANGRADIVQLLVDAGASLALKNGCGKTPLDAARLWGKHDIVAILEAAAAGGSDAIDARLAGALVEAGVPDDVQSQLVANGLTLDTLDTLDMQRLQQAGLTKFRAKLALRRLGSRIEKRENKSDLDLFLVSIDCQEWLPLLKQNNIADVDSLCQQSNDALKALGIVKLAHRKRIIRGWA
jgi:Ankyrin repeats (3 copies)/SAM domain (Sterile alpha motif)